MAAMAVKAAPLAGHGLGLQRRLLAAVGWFGTAGDGAAAACEGPLRRLRSMARERGWRGLVCDLPRARTNYHPGDECYNECYGAADGTKPRHDRRQASSALDG